MPAIASHVFCNIMGFPDPMQAIESFPSMKGRESSRVSPSYRRADADRSRCAKCSHHRVILGRNRWLHLWAQAAVVTRVCDKGIPCKSLQNIRSFTPIAEKNVRSRVKDTFQMQHLNCLQAKGGSRPSVVLFFPSHVSPQSNLMRLFYSVFQPESRRRDRLHSLDLGAPSFLLGA